MYIFCYSRVHYSKPYTTIKPKSISFTHSHSQVSRSELINCQDQRLVMDDLKRSYTKKNGQGCK